MSSNKKRNKEILGKKLREIYEERREVRCECEENKSDSVKKKQGEGRKRCNGCVLMKRNIDYNN